MADLPSVFEGCANWLRLVTLVDYAGEVLGKKVFEDEGMPSDGVELYKQLKKYDIRNLKDDQEKIVFPKEKRTDVHEFDITLWTHLIQQMFKSGKKTKYYHLTKTLRDIRNPLSHMSLLGKEISDLDFEEKWKSTCAKLKECSFKIDQTVKDLKMCPLVSITDIQKILKRIELQLPGSV